MQNLKDEIKGNGRKQESSGNQRIDGIAKDVIKNQGNKYNIKHDRGEKEI